MQGVKFKHKNQDWVIVEIKNHNDNFRTQLGWTHFAMIKRPNGNKTYCTNLLVENGQVLQANVVL